MRALGLSDKILLPMACNKWVLPSPVPPYKNSGLVIGSPGFLATFNPAERASSLDLPPTKFSNKYCGLRLERNEFAIALSADGLSCTDAVASTGCGATICATGLLPSVTLTIKFGLRLNSCAILVICAK